MSTVPASAMRVGRYEVLRRIAVSNVAELVLARLVGLSDFRKLVVLKWLRPDIEGVEGVEDVERLQALFAREARIAARLDHPNIVHTVDFGLAQGRPFVAMEYVHGEPLASLRGKARYLPLDCALRVVTELLAALEYAHTRADDDGSSLGIVHRDVSPANVVVTYEGHVVLVDFGMARADAWEDLTYTGEIRGALDLAPPEQIRGEALDGRADVFAVGVMLSSLIDDADRAAIEPILAPAVAIDRRDRYPSAAAMRDALLLAARERGLDMSSVPLSQLVRSLFDERPHPSAAPQSWFAGVKAAAANGGRPSATGPATRSRSRSRSRWWLGAAIAAVLTIGVGLWVTRSSPTTTIATPHATVLPSPLPEPVPATTPVASTPAASPVAAPEVPTRIEPKRARPSARRQPRRSTPRDPDAALPTRENR